MAVKALSGGDKLAAKLAEISKNVSQRAELRVGVLEKSTYPDGTPVAMVAAIQEFGAPKVGIPPRPFFRPLIAAKAESWGVTTANLLVKNGYDAGKTLDTLGEGIASQLHQSLLAVSGPPLSPVTLLLRQRFGNNPQDIKFSDVQKAREDIASGTVPKVTATQGKPLVWTGVLENSFGHEVDEG